MIPEAWTPRTPTHCTNTPKTHIQQKPKSHRHRTHPRTTDTGQSRQRTANENPTTMDTMHIRSPMKPTTKDSPRKEGAMATLPVRRAARRSHSLKPLVRARPGSVPDNGKRHRRHNSNQQQQSGYTGRGRVACKVAELCNSSQQGEAVVLYTAGAIPPVAKNTPHGWTTSQICRPEETSCCNVKKGISSSRRYLPTNLPWFVHIFQHVYISAMYS